MDTITRPSLRHILTEFDAIGLKEIGKSALTDRVDTKFIFNKAALGDVLMSASKDYKILEINSERLLTYDNTYFDTEDLKFYLDHHNGKTTRTKVRMRRYVESDTAFLEIKQKYNTGRLQKFRKPIERMSPELSKRSAIFVETLTSGIGDLYPVLENSFRRITLVNSRIAERITFDIDLRFKGDSEPITFEDLVIAEIKQPRNNRSTGIFDILRSKGIAPYRISKYCIGLAKMNDGLKQNRFKKKLRMIAKITAD